MMQPLPSSFRDPSGFIFRHEDCIYRQVNKSFADQYDFFMASGLYERLVSKGFLVRHEVVSDDSVEPSEGCYKTLRPEQIPFISYPYEWSFSQLKDAAILTLRIQNEALKHGLMLKDASAFNVQFLNSKPVFIDTLSFAPYVEGAPWVAYKQFCQHFLAPLALMAYTDINLAKLSISHIDGVPLQLASKLLPFRSKFNFSLATHIHLHSRMQQEHGDAAGKNLLKKARSASLSRKGLHALIEALAGAIDRLKWEMPETEWGDYYAKTNYSDRAGSDKRSLIDRFLAEIPDELAIVQDFGANTGEFSQIAARYAQLVVSQDIDPVAVELNYCARKTNGPKNILPLIQDFSSPSPSIGWANAERSSFLERSKCDAMLALALIHHIAISNNVPLANIARLFASLTRWLIIEFVPKADSQVIRLLATREDIFDTYDQRGFEEAFRQYFTIEATAPVEESERTLYLMKTL